MKLSCCHVHLIWSMYTSVCICTRTYVYVHERDISTYIKSLLCYVSLTWSMYTSVCICTRTYALYTYVCMVRKYIHKTLVMLCLSYMKMYTHVHICTVTYVCTRTYVWCINTYMKPSSCYVSAVHDDVHVREDVHVRIYMYTYVRMYTYVCMVHKYDWYNITVVLHHCDMCDNEIHSCIPGSSHLFHTKLYEIQQNYMKFNKII